MPKGVYVRTEKHCLALSEARKGKPHPVGKPRTQEQREAMSRARTGKFTEAQRLGREKLFAKWKAEGYWPTKGWSPTEETREKIRQAQLVTVPSKLKRYGINTEEYLAQKAAGNKWCWFGKHWVSGDKFEKKKTRGTCEGCKAAAYRVSDLKKKYGVTPEWYDSTLVAQGGGCAICGRTETHTVRTRNLMIDHDHDSGNVRGILCVSCNTAIERLETVPKWDDLAQAYLDKYKCSTTIQTAI